MGTFGLRKGRRAGHRRTSWRALLPAMLIGMLAGALMAIPMVRTAEIHEVNVAKERLESFSVGMLAGSKKRSGHKGCQAAAVAVYSSRLSSAPSRGAGALGSKLYYTGSDHRLANGLLAPLRC